MSWLRLPPWALAYAAALQGLALVLYYGALLTAVGLALLLVLLPGPAHGAGLLTMLVAAPVMQLAIHVPEWLALPWSLYLHRPLSGWMAWGNLPGPLVRAAILLPAITVNAGLLLAAHGLVGRLRAGRESP